MIKREAEDVVKDEQWDTCNNMVIAWLMGSMSGANGARKYKLSREVYELKQNERSIIEYYTEMNALWEEIKGLNLLLAITEMSTEVNEFIKVINQLKEEQHLFQFLNGLHEDYAPQRSQIRMQSSLLSVEIASGSLL